SMDLAFVGCGVFVRLREDSRTIDSALIALGAVGPTVEMAAEAAEMLRGAAVDLKRLRECGESAAETCHPIDDLRASARYRRRLVVALVIDAAQEACRR